MILWNKKLQLLLCCLFLISRQYHYQSWQTGCDKTYTHVSRNKYSLFLSKLSNPSGDTHTHTHTHTHAHMHTQACMHAHTHTHRTETKHCLKCKITSTIFIDVKHLYIMTFSKFIHHLWFRQECYHRCKLMTFVIFLLRVLIIHCSLIK